MSNDEIVKIDREHPAPEDIERLWARIKQLAESIVYKHQTVYGDSQRGYTREDLMQECVIAMYDALRTWDCKRAGYTTAYCICAQQHLRDVTGTSYGGRKGATQSDD